MADEKKQAEIIPIRQGQVVKELSNYVAKSFDNSYVHDGGANEIWTDEFKAWLEGDTLKGLFFTEDWVFIVTDLIANKISSQPMRVMQTVVEDGKETSQPDPEHPLNMLLDQPNEWQDYASWMYQTCVELYLMGNAVIWHSGKNGQLLTLATENITMDFGNQGEVANYMMATFSNDGSSTPSEMSVFPAKEVMHVRRPNPNSLLWGLSPFIPGRKSILFNRYSTDYLNSFYLKQATPGLALTLDRNVNEDVALRQLRSFEVAYQGRKNARRTLILPKGVSATPLSHTLADQKLLDHIKVNRETICGLLKIPKHELGLQEAGSLGSQEHRIALRNFWESTLKPGMDMISGIMTKFFQTELGEDRFFEFDLSDVEALTDDLQAKAGIAKAMLEGGLSLNEVRERVWEAEASDSPGADQPFPLAQLQSRIIEPVEVQPEEEEEPETRSRKIASTPRLEECRAACVKQLDDEESRKINELSRLAVDILTNMTTKAIEVIEGSIKSAKYETKQDLPSKRVLRRRIERALEDDFEESWQNDIARTLESSIDVGYDGQLDLVFNVQDRRQIQALKERDEEDRRLTLEARGLESFAQISQSHTERIMKQITKGQEAGESITDIMRRVANALGTPGELAGRAETIARTETLTAVSIGQAAAAENTKEVIPGAKKAWLTAGDGRVRDSHAALDGDVVEIDEKFDNGLRHPRDTAAGDPSEVINCFPADTEFAAANPEKIYKRYYSGPMVTVYFEGGNKLTGTPNHPVLTISGWKALSNLNKFDQVVKATDIEEFIDLNIVAMKAKAGQFFDAFDKSLISVGEARRIVNFHGDVFDENVNVKDIDWFLQECREAFCREKVTNFDLINTYFTESASLGFSRKSQSFGGVFSSHGFIGGANLFSSGFDIHFRPFEKLGLTSIPPSEPKLSKVSGYRYSGDIKDFRQLRDMQIFSDMKFMKVSKIDISSFSGQVYNLQTSSGVYLANNIVSHNCRCTLLIVAPEDEDIFFEPV